MKITPETVNLDQSECWKINSHLEIYKAIYSQNGNPQYKAKMELFPDRVGFFLSSCLSRFQKMPYLFSLLANLSVNMQNNNSKLGKSNQ